MSPSLLAMLNTPEIIALLVIALVLFGAKKLPELAKGLGQGIKEFKKASREVTNELHNAVESEPPPPPPPTPYRPPESIPQSTAMPENAEVSNSEAPAPKA